MKFRFLYLMLLITSMVFAQSKKVELIKARVLIGTSLLGEPIRKLSGDVVFKHGDVMLYCDSSYQYELKNDLEAFGTVKIIKNDTQNVAGDHMFYYGDTRLAKITGKKVVLISGSVHLYTTILDYDLNQDMSNYYNKGTVIDKENKLISDIGTFYKTQNLFVFIKNVVFTDKKYTIYTDTLEYNTETKIIKARGPTKIVGPDGITHSDKLVEYDSKTKVSNFNGRTKITYTNFVLNADKVFYDQFSQTGKARGNVEIFSKKDSLTIFGDEALYWGATGKSKVFPNALAQIVNAGDTLFLSSDTLLAINDTVKKEKKIYAYHKVKVYNKSMQAICDSLIYDMADSTLWFYKDPVMWNSKNQLRGDTIKAVSKNKVIDKVYFNTKAFAISVDTIENYNQVKGKRMTAFFVSNKLSKVDVKGNSETVYFALQGDSAVMGLNKVQSEDLTVNFKSQKLKKITFRKKPKGVLIPPHEIKDDDLRLKGFKWRIKERPSKETVLGKYYKKPSELNK